MWTIRRPVVLPAATAQFQFDFEWLLLALALMGVVLLGLYVVARFKRKLAQEQAAQPLRVEDYRALMEQGLLQPQEFERIREHLERRTPPPTPPQPADPTAIQSFEPPRRPDPRPPSTGIRDPKA